jgi:hypothetical protein
MEAAFVLGVIFAFIVVIVMVEAKRKERMFLLKQGKDPSLAGSKETILSSITYLKWGIIIISVGAGALLGSMLRNIKGVGNDSVFISCLMICSGIGIVVSYLVTRQAAPSDKPKEEEAPE